MDPDACLRELLDALNDDDRDTAIERCHNLAEWLASGGFMAHSIGVADEFLQGCGYDTEPPEDDDDEN
jgi:hypothetical protein